MPEPTTIHWSDINNDPKYQDLPDEEQDRVKALYYRRRILKDPEFEKADPILQRETLEYFTGVGDPTVSTVESIGAGIKGAFKEIGKEVKYGVGSSEAWLWSLDKVLRGIVGTIGGPAVFNIGAFRGDTIPEGFKEGAKAVFETFAGGEIVSPNIVVEERTGKPIREHVYERLMKGEDPAANPTQYAFAKTIGDIAEPIIDLGLYIAIDPLIMAPMIGQTAIKTQGYLRSAQAVRAKAREAAIEAQKLLELEAARLPKEYHETLAKVIKYQKETEAAAVKAVPEPVIKPKPTTIETTRALEGQLTEARLPEVAIARMEADPHYQQMKAILKNRNLTNEQKATELSEVFTNAQKTLKEQGFTDEQTKKVLNRISEEYKGLTAQPSKSTAAKQVTIDVPEVKVTPEAPQQEDIGAWFIEQSRRDAAKMAEAERQLKTAVQMEKAGWKPGSIEEAIDTVAPHGDAAKRDLRLFLSGGRVSYEMKGKDVVFRIKTDTVKGAHDMGRRLRQWGTVSYTKAAKGRTIRFTYKGDWSVPLPEARELTQGELDTLFGQQRFAAPSRPDVALGMEERLSQTAGVEAPKGVPQSRQAIIDYFQDKTGLMMKIGKFRTTVGGFKAAGIWKPGKGVGRIRSAQDVQSAFHEFGHGMWTDFGLQESFGKAEKDLLYKLSGKPYPFEQFPKMSVARRQNEGFADYISSWVTDHDKIINNADLVTLNARWDDVLAQSPELNEIFYQSRDMFNLYLKQEPLARAMGNIKFAWDKTKGLPFNEKIHRIYELWFDDLHQVKRVTDSVRKVLNRELVSTEDAYLLGRIMRGNAAKAGEFIHGKPFVIKEGVIKFEGESIKDILRPIEGQYEEFATYLAVRRSREYVKKGLAQPFHKKDIEHILKNAPEIFKTQSDKMNKLSQQLLDYLEHTKVLSADQKELILSKWDFYAPLYRVMEYEGVGTGAGRAIAPAPRPLKAVKGSERIIIDPIESFIKNTYAFINAGDRNRALLAYVDAMRKAGKLSGKFAERVPIRLKPLKVNFDEFLNGLEDPALKEGLSAIKSEGMQNITATIFRPNRYTAPNELIVYRNGKPELYEVPEEILRGFKNLDAMSLRHLAQIFTYPARLLRAGAVGAPEFMLARNPVRDTFSAFINSRYGFVPGYDTLRGMMHMIKKDEAYHLFNTSGGAFATLVDVDRDAMKWAANLARKGRWGKTVYVAQHPLEALRYMGALTENSTRVGEFANALKTLDPDGVIRETTLLKAGYAAREVTLDFGRSGAVGRFLNSLIAFWNASVQGTDKMVRQFRDRPAVTSLRIAGGITIPSLTLWAVNKDYEWYNDLESWEKNTYWWIGTSERPLLKIPKPFDYGIVFGSGAERLMELLSKKYPDAVKKWAADVIKNVSPGVVPTAGVGIAEEWANKVFYTGRRIIPQGEEDLEPELQVGPYTRETSRLIGKVFGVSPRRVEHIVRAHGATLGKHLLNLSDAIIVAAHVVDRPELPTKDVSDYPVISGVTKRYPFLSAEIQKFYEHYEKARKADRSLKEYVKQEYPKSRIEEYIERNRDYLVIGDTARKFALALSKLRQRQGQIRRDKTLNADQKREQIDETIREMNKLAKAFNDNVEIGK